MYIKLIYSILYCLLRIIAMEFCYEKSVRCGLIFCVSPRLSEVVQYCKYPNLKSGIASQVLSALCLSPLKPSLSWHQI